MMLDIEEFGYKYMNLKDIVSFVKTTSYPNRTSFWSVDYLQKDVDVG